MVGQTITRIERGRRSPTLNILGRKGVNNHRLARSIFCTNLGERVYITVWSYEIGFGEEMDYGPPAPVAL